MKNKRSYGFSNAPYEHSICVECGEVYDPLYVKSNRGFCPKMSCGGMLITCDDLIMAAVYELNSRGYQTFHSCSGHPGSRVDSTYITFTSSPERVMDVVNIVIKPYGDVCFNVAIGSIQRPGDCDYDDILEDRVFYGTTTRTVDKKTVNPDILDQFERVASEAAANNKDCIVVVRPAEELIGKAIYAVIGEDHKLLTDVNEALYEMARALPVAW